MLEVLLSLVPILMVAQIMRLVNTTGDIESSWNFFNYAKLSSDVSVSEESQKIFLTITDASSLNSIPPVLANLRASLVY